MGKKTELETELAALKASLEGAETDEVKEELAAKIAQLETDLENATDEDELDEVADDLERLQEWARNELGVPLSEIKTELADLKTLVEKLARKIKAAKTEPEPEPTPTPIAPPAPPSPPSPPPPPEPVAKPQREITRL